MVAKRLRENTPHLSRLNLAKIHMVAKLAALLQYNPRCLNLAKIHMVAKRGITGMSFLGRLNLAKIHMVAKHSTSKQLPNVVLI